jgi:peroxiredoxin
MRYAKVMVSIVVLVLPFAGMIIARDGFWNDRNDPAGFSEVFLKQLSVEGFSKTVPAPDFSLEDPRGNLLKLRDLRGKVVLLNFWATWCPACNQEMASMEALHRKLSEKGLVIVAINFREEPEEVNSFLQKHRLSFRVVLDRDGAIFTRYETWSLPTSYLIGRNGNLLGKVIGYREWDSAGAMAAFRSLLNDQS